MVSAVCGRVRAPVASGPRAGRRSGRTADTIGGFMGTADAIGGFVGTADTIGGFVWEV